MIVNAEDWNTVCYNTLLWTPNKGEMKECTSGGLIRLNMHYFPVIGKLSGYSQFNTYSTDDYVAVSSACAVNDLPDANMELYVTNEWLKEQEKESRDKTGELDIELPETEKPLYPEMFSLLHDMIWNAEPYLVEIT